MGGEVYSSDIDKIILNEREKPLCSFSELSLSELSLSQNLSPPNPGADLRRGSKVWVRERQSWVVKQFAQLKTQQDEVF